MPADLKILFFCSPYQKPSWARYQHTSVVLAEGFEELGIPFYGNIDYWYFNEDKKYLIKRSPNNYDANVHIYSSHYLLDYPDQLKNVNYSVVNVLLDNEDGFDTPCMDPKFKDFNLILRCHYNNKFKSFKYPMPWAKDKMPNYLPNVKPWNFGLSRRQIKYTDMFRDRTVKDRILINFRMEHNLRSMATEGFNKVLSPRYNIVNKITESLELEETDNHFSYWSQTGRRHNEDYFKDINESRFIYAFGGKFYYDPIGNDILSRTKQLSKRGFAYISNQLGLPPKENLYYTMTQYGGWRLFEAFLSNSCPIQIDFKYWDLSWPVMPEHGKHYWSVKGFRFEESAKELLKLNEQEISNIAENGRKWALDNYAPKAVAERSLNYIKNL